MDVQDFFDTFSFIERLERQPRAGWHQAGVRRPENVAAHSYGVAMVAMWLSDYLIERGQEIDVEKVLRMSLLHDVGEAITTDIPKPLKNKLSGIDALERDAESIVLSRAPEMWQEKATQYNLRDCVESRIVKSADHLQMMLMASQYERESRLNLSNFFKNSGTEFEIVAELAAAIIRARSEK